MIVSVVVVPALFPKEDKRVTTWCYFVPVFSYDAEAAPWSFFGGSIRGVAQVLGSSLKFPAAGFSLAASVVSLCNCISRPALGCHLLAPP